MAGGDAVLAPVQMAQEDVYSEQSIIGSMLIDPGVVGLVVSELTEDDFSMQANKALFRAFRQKYLAGEVIDPVTVLALAAPGDRSMRDYAMQLMDITPTAANVGEYIRQTRTCTQVRRLHSIGRTLEALTTPQDALPTLKAGMDMLSQDGRDDEAGMVRALEEFVLDFDRKPEYLHWGLPFLDKGLFVERGDFVVVAGRPSDGKTALALHMAMEQSKTLKVGFFSMETKRIKLVTRLVSATSGIPLSRIKSRTLNDDEHMLFSDSVKELAARDNLRLIDAAGWTAEQIEARTLARRFDVIYVDYLQLITPSRRRNDRTSDVSDISMALANLARRHNVAVVALSQLSRPTTKGDRPEPVLSDLRESGQIEQDADVVMFIWRKTENASDAARYLTMAKNKEGMLGGWELAFRGDIQRFVPGLSGGVIKRDNSKTKGKAKGKSKDEDDDDPF